MGRPLGGTNIMRTPEEKEKIVLEYINNKVSYVILANKYGTTRTVIRRWYYKYCKSGFEGLKAETGKKKGGNKGLGNKKSKSHEEELELKVMKLKIENAHLKKGYLVKGVGAKKEYITTLKETMK